MEKYKYKYNDLSGQKFGRLTVIRRVENKIQPGGAHKIMYECLCDCGTTKIVTASNLKRGTTRSCGCLSREMTSKKSSKNLVGQQFGRLTVIERAEEDYINPSGNRVTKYRCLCECGNVVDVVGTSLTMGYTNSCGCLHREVVRKFNDLSGQKFGKLTVIERFYDEEKYKNRIMYRCVCECGTETIVDGNSLKRGVTKSCGKSFCMFDGPPKNFIDLTGRRFGKLLVLERSEDRISSNGYCATMYKCLCDCGTVKDIWSRSLLTGHTQSCGCTTMSHGEIKIQQMLDANNIKYLYDSSYFDDLIVGQKTLRCDFIIFNDDKPIRVIEFDGAQHFQNIKYFGNKLERQKQLDEIKNEYFFTKNIPLIRIPYTDEDIFTYEDIWSEKYLVKIKKEKGDKNNEKV